MALWIALIDQAMGSTAVVNYAPQVWNCRISLAPQFMAHIYSLCKYCCWGPVYMRFCVCSCWREQGCRPMRLPLLGLPPFQQRRSSFQPEPSCCRLYPASTLVVIPLFGGKYELPSLPWYQQFHPVCAAHWSPGVAVVCRLPRPTTPDGDLADPFIDSYDTSTLIGTLGSYAAPLSSRLQAGASVVFSHYSLKMCHVPCRCGVELAAAFPCCC